MTRRIPLFPLPGVVLLPGTLLPLHIFEPRYRAMIAAALEGDRTIGMAMLKPGWEASEEPPEIYPVGGAGEIVESEPLEDGRYNVILVGRFRFRVVAESLVDAYRLGEVEPIASIPFSDPAEQDRVVSAAVGLFAEMRGHIELPPLPSEPMPAERLSSEIALRLRYEPGELQELLETDSLASRFETLIGRMAQWHGRIRFLAPFRLAGIDPGSN